MTDALHRRSFAKHIDGTLRARPTSLRWLLAIIVTFSLAYGLVMGSFSIDGHMRAKQMLYSSLKMPLLLLATFAISLPSFFVLNTLMGVRDDFRIALRSVAATQAALSIVLASVAPLTAVWYASSASYERAVMFNAAMFALASIAAQWMLRRLYRPLIARDPRHRLLLRSWLMIYAFVGIQMGWLLRPFIGSPGVATTFFRAESWGNAYVVVWNLLTVAVRGH
ncbi:hypothetical protein BH10PLA1_BH10PLA1_19010 [soil metagenome]